MLPRVLILYTGGTFGMDIQQDLEPGSVLLSIPKLSAKLLKQRMQQRIPELKKIARCDVEVILNRDSAHIGPAEWLLFAEKIQKKWKVYDGFVLIHGTDTLAYTASALSFLLRPLLKPVVLTGAQRPLAAIRTDARNNLLSAVEIAARGPKDLTKQVTVFFDEKLFQGNRVRKRSASDFAAFECPYSSPLAVVGTTIRYAQPKAFRGNKARKNFTWAPRFSHRVLMAHITPSFPAEVLQPEFLSHVDGLVLVAYLSGTAPTHQPHFKMLLSRLRDLGIPTVIVTEGSAQSPGPDRSTVTYAVGHELLSYGCYPAGAMTPECAYVKTAYILGQTEGRKRFGELWSSDLAGEGG